MKKSYIIILFLLFSSKNFSQKLTKVDIDKKISLLLPVDYTVIDTLGSKVYSGNIFNGVVAVSILQDVRGKITDEKELDDFFKKFKKGMIEQVEGRVSTESFIKINSIKINKFTFLTDMSNLIQWNVYAMRIDSKTYSVAFIYKEETNEIKTETEIIDSLKFSDE